MKRKSVLRFAWEIIRFIILKMPRYRSTQIGFSGIAILFVSGVLISSYGVSANIMIVPMFIGVGLILLGLLYMGVEFAPEDDEEEEPEIVMFKTVMKELKDIKNRLEKLEKHHEQDKIKGR
ncbi:MAG: hypothetical protein KKA79_00450 [Nanoarchaeota archaeon]|nr:hypothetical protein [Nanoarchaeota archaeon]